MAADPGTEGGEDRQQRILDAALHLLAEHGIGGVSIRAVAREAGVAHGLVSYYFTDKVGLVLAALRRIETQDIALVAPKGELPAEDELRMAIRRVASPEFLTTPYLSLRLQLWSLATADPQFEAINTQAQNRYRKGLSDLVHAARPDLPRAECNRRADDITVIQNGLWLTALLGLDRASAKRAVARCEDIALA